MTSIIGVETVNVAEFNNLIWVRLHTDAGIVGLGETFRNPAATVAYVHETCAPMLLGRDVLDRAAIEHALVGESGTRFRGYPTRSIEVRGNSAVDMAVWDACGQALGVPTWRLLGGRVNEWVRIYNTCASAGYNSVARTEGEFVAAGPQDGTISRLDDLNRQEHDPAGLARELLDEGITAMKVWPFDAAARATRGMDIGRSELSAAMAKLEAVRAEVGDAMDIMVEFHGLWTLPAAMKIVDALKEVDPYWLEEPIDIQNVHDLATYRTHAGGRVAAGESMGSLAWYREAFRLQAVDFVHFDMGWIGGLSEGQRIAHLAKAFDRPIAPHDCTGPVTLMNNLHLLTASSNALIAETVRAYLRLSYPRMVTQLPEISGGYARAGDEPGLGTQLLPELLERPDCAAVLSGKRCN